MAEKMNTDICQVALAPPTNHHSRQEWGTVTVDLVTGAKGMAKLDGRFVGMVAIDPVCNLWAPDGIARYYSNPLPAAADLALAHVANAQGGQTV